MTLSPASIRQNRARLRTIDFGQRATHIATKRSMLKDSAAIRLRPHSACSTNCKRSPIRVHLCRTGASETSEIVELVVFDRSLFCAKTHCLPPVLSRARQPIETHAQYEKLSRELPVAGVPMILSGWSYTLANLLPWAATPVAHC